MKKKYNLPPPDFMYVRLTIAEYNLIRRMREKTKS